MTTQPAVGLTGRTPTSPGDFYVVDSSYPALNVVARIQNVATETYCRAVYGRVEVDNTVSLAMAVVASLSVEDGAVIGSLYGVWVYQNASEAGSAVSNAYGIAVDMNNSEAATYCGAFRIYCHGGTVDSVFHLANSGGTPFTNLFDFDGQVSPVSGYGSENTGTYKVACTVGADTCYMVLFK